jgi:hypothetical protein
VYVPYLLIDYSFGLLIHCYIKSSGTLFKYPAAVVTVIICNVAISILKCIELIGLLHQQSMDLSIMATFLCC